MSKIVLTIVFILMAGRNYAQQDYFVLIQADDNQPFYARMGGDNKIISSSGQGHLILSQLKEGSYIITIGFPKKLFPELQFSFTINKKDLELQLKDLGEKGWGLFNLQTLELKMPDEKKGDESRSHLEGVKKDDAFSRLMAGVVSDTAVMYNTYAMEATLKEPPVAPKTAATDTASSAGLQGITSPNGKNAADEPLSGVKSTDSSGKDAPATPKVPQTVTELPADIASKVDTANKEVLPSPLTGKDTSIVARTMNSPSLNDTLKEGRPAMDSLFTDASRPAVAGMQGSNGQADSLRARDSASSNSGSAIMSGISPAASGPGTAPVTSGAGIPSVPSSLPRKISPVVKISERKTTKGVRLVYADHSRGSKADTIVVIIPVDSGTRMAQRPGEGKLNGVQASSVRTDTPTVAAAGPDHSAASQDHPATLSNGSGISAQKTAANTPLFRPDTSQKKTGAKSLFINSDCKNFATDYDVDKLRVKMLESGKDEDRITAAHKVFKTRCFTTRQIRALSEVFTSDAQKFRFFETAYPFVSDDHFKELTDLLADPVYNSKFRSMTGQ